MREKYYYFILNKEKMLTEPQLKVELEDLH